MLDKITKHMKRSSTILLTLAILATTSVIAYAFSLLFFEGEVQTSEYSKKTYFEFDSSAFFTASGEVGPGESMRINPVITSEATVDMYVFIGVEMPVCGSAGLYELNTVSGWECIESGSVDDKWVEVYRYNDILTPGASTIALGNSLTMINMSLTDYAALDDINVEMIGYTCGTEDESFETAWDSIKGIYGM